jgi:hypothetical protein
MPLTLDQLVKSLLLKTFDKSGPAVAAQIDDFWEGDSADSFLKCLKSSSQRASFLLYYYKAFVGPIKHKSAYSAYKSYFESIHSDGANPELSCRKLLIHLKSYWTFYSSFNPLLYQLGGEILIPVLFSSREVVQKSGCPEDKIINEMSRISFCLECGFSRVIFLKSKLSAVDARIVGLCKTILKCKNSKDIIEEIKSFYRHTSFGLNDDSDFRKSIEEFKFKSQGFTLVFLEQGGTDINEVRWNTVENPLLILGNETTGIPKDFIKQSVNCIFVSIPQHSVMRSMNVAMAASIAIWEINKIKDKVNA